MAPTLLPPPTPQRQTQYFVSFTATDVISDSSFTATDGTSDPGTKPIVVLHLQEERYHPGVPPPYYGSCRCLPLNQLKRFDLSRLATFSYAERALAKMLTNSNFNTSDFKLLRSYLSFFIHRAAIAARTREVGSLLLTLTIRVVDRDVSPGGLVASETEMEFPESCPICIDDFAFTDGDDIISVPCGHIFHGACLRQWLQRGGDCPLCRFAL